MGNWFLDVMFGQVLNGGDIEITMELDDHRYEGPFNTEVEAWQRLLVIHDTHHATEYDATINPLLKLYRDAVQEIENGSTNSFTLLAAVQLKKVLLAAGQHEPFPAWIKSARSTYAE